MLDPPSCIEIPCSKYNVDKNTNQSCLYIVDIYTFDTNTRHFIYFYLFISKFATQGGQEDNSSLPDDP